MPLNLYGLIIPQGILLYKIPNKQNNRKFSFRFCIFSQFVPFVEKFRSRHSLKMLFWREAQPLSPLPPSPRGGEGGRNSGACSAKTTNFVRRLGDMHWGAPPRFPNLRIHKSLINRFSRQIGRKSQFPVSCCRFHQFLLGEPRSCQSARSAAGRLVL